MVTALGTLTLAFVCVAIWLGLLFARGGYWRMAERLGNARSSTHPPVLAIVPARNEATTIERALTSLLVQDYRGRLDIVLVDDQSTDETGRRAEAVALRAGDRRAVHVVRTASPPAGWSGKTWAQLAGLRHADDLGLEAPWLWLTDADIVHDADVLARLLGEAEASDAALVSVMVDLEVASPAERWLVPAFVYFFALLYPFARVRSADRRVAAAAGGCVLVRRATFDRAGGFRAIHDRLIDDVALAQTVKASGGAIALCLDHASRSLRRYDLATFWAMVRRTAFTELGYSHVRLVLALGGLALVFLAPPLLALFADGPARALGVAAWAMMAWSYGPILRWYGLHRAWAFILPLTAAAYMAMTIHSALAHRLGQRAVWRGRAYRA